MQQNELNAFLWTAPEESIPDGPLNGVSIGVKDNICHQGWPTTAGSKILENFVPPYTATILQRLRAAGARLAGKTNMDEFGMGSSTENSAYGPTRNPWDLARVPGGSSGGSAAAVAADLCQAALGSDTGGSIRQPAALCGITGLKPTYGRVSRYGLIAYGSSLDQIGPMAYTAETCARVLQAIAGPDPFDSTCYQEPAGDYLGLLEQPLADLRLGWDLGLLEGLDPLVRSNFQAGLEVYRSLGVKIIDLKLSSMDYALPAYYLIATAEASSNLARYDGVRYGHRASEGSDVAKMMSKSRAEGFGPEVKRRIMLGTYALSAGYYDAYYHQAQKVRTLLRNNFDGVFAQVDAFALPTTPETAFKLGDKSDDPLSMYLSDIYTVHANLTGLPALSHPAGFVNGLPLGLQLIGPAWQEGRLLQMAHQFQDVTNYHLQRPRLAAAQA